MHTPGNLAKAYEYSCQLEYDLAIAEYDAVLRLEPDNAFALYQRGYCRHVQGDYNRALEDFLRAMCAGPSLAGEYHVFISRTYRALAQRYHLLATLDPELQACCAFILERVPKKRWLQDACLRLMHSAQSGDDKLAGQVLQRIANVLKPPPVENLIESLKDQNYLLRKVAAFALGEMGEAAEPAIPALIGALKDAWGPNRMRETDVSRRAAEALGQIGSAAVPALMAVLKERQCRMAARALAIIEGGNRAQPT
jgi:HEAT repeat protein